MSVTKNNVRTTTTMAVVPSEPSMLIPLSGGFS
jgi:hypothetical protein